MNYFMLSWLCVCVCQSVTADRLRVVYLLTRYYDSQPSPVQQLVLNPRECEWGRSSCSGSVTSPRNSMTLLHP